jgi:3-hydroxyisobutyrate dehydrogenase
MSTGTSTTVAFIGLGNMGGPMTANLVQAGFTVVGVHTHESRATAWGAQHGMRSVVSLADTIADVDVVVTMLPTGVEVRTVLMGAAPLARAGLVAIDMSSADPVGTRQLGDDLAEFGVRLVDAPVSGGVARAVDGTLSIMIGGEAGAIETARPVLSALGSSLFEVGRLGNGHALKCLNNFVAGAAFVACSEALAVGEQFGLDPDVLFDVINVSTGRSFTSEIVMKQHVVSGEFGTGFALGLLAKDVAIADGLAHAVGRSTPLADLVTDRLAEARDALGFGVDHSRAHEFWSDSSTDR